MKLIDLLDQIYNSMQLKTTDELKLILEYDDREEWSDTAFDVVKQILLERTGELPLITKNLQEYLLIGKT